MTTLKVTQLEKQVLEVLAGSMEAELGYSCTGYPEIKEETGLDMKTIRGVVGSLVKKDMITVWDRDGEYGKDMDMYIIYLTDKTNGLVENWVREDNIEPVQLIVG